MELGEFVLLQEAVDELRPHIIAVAAEYGALQEHFRAAGHIVFAIEVLVPGLGNQIEP
jgi:hypothetical protein